jgi:catechol 2,3-dioxygenase-like lactoylglutathione lyase family enzyme
MEKKNTQMINLRHVGITVTSMDKSLALYRDLFDLKVIWDEIEQGEFVDSLSGIKNIKVRTVKLQDKIGGVIELLEYHSHPEKNGKNLNNKITEIGCSHFAVTVNNLTEIYKKLTSVGLNFNDKPKISPNGKAKVCFCRDLDGTLIELVEEI